MLFGLGAALIPDGLPHLQKFPLWINQPLGIHEKKPFKLCLCLWRVHSVQKHKTQLALTHTTLKKYSRRVELHVEFHDMSQQTLQYKKNTFMWSTQSSSNQCRFSLFCGLKTCPADYTKKDFHTGQYSGGFTLHLSLPPKTKQFRKHAANTSLATQSHRKCTECLKTKEAELGGFTVTEQSRTIQEASNCLKRQHTTGVHQTRIHNHRSICRVSWAMACQGFMLIFKPINALVSDVLKLPPLWSTLKYLNNYWMDCREQTFMVPRGWILITSGQNFILPSTLVYHQIPAKLLTFPSTSAVICF